MKKRMRVVIRSKNGNVGEEVIMSNCNERLHFTVMTSKKFLRILTLDDIDSEIKLDMKTKNDGFKINEEYIGSSQQRGKHPRVAS